MNYELKYIIAIIIYFYLIVNISASPSQPSMNHEVNQAKQDYPGQEWERELQELRSLASGQTFNTDRENAEKTFLKNEWRNNREKQHLKKGNGTVASDFLDLQPFTEDMDFPLPHLTTTTVNFLSYNNTLGSKEEVELLKLSKGLNSSKNYSKKKSATKSKSYGEGNAADDKDNDDYDDDYENYSKENDEWGETTERPNGETTSSYDSLVESLTIFLGSPERSLEISSRRNHKSNKEMDFEGLSELDTVRKMGKGANIPQDLVDAVDPEADENLLELMVRIAENPVEWRNVHKAIQRLDRAILTSDQILAHSYDKKEIGKRSSPYSGETSQNSRKRQKHSKLRKRKNHRYNAGNENWAKDFFPTRKSPTTEKQKTNRKNRNKNHRHRSKNKNKQMAKSTLPHSYKLKHDSGQKIRHGVYENKNSEYGKYSENSINSVIEKLRLKSGYNSYPYNTNLKPKSAPLASEVFNNNENKNFERWKVKYEGKTDDDNNKYPEWPSFRDNFDYLTYNRPKINPKKVTNHGHETKYHHRHHDSSSFKNKLKEIRRWGLLKQSRKNLIDKWSRTNNEVDENNNWKDKNNNVKSVEREQNKLAEKAKMLAANNWSAPQPQKEKVWPHFTYHRVTSSPSVQQRDAGAQPRHRSAYVAVSVIPSNTTGNTNSKNLPPSKPSVQNSNSQIQNSSQQPQTKTLPDLFNQLVDDRTKSNKDEKNSLKTVEERFNFKNEDRTRLHQVMRDGSSSNNKKLF